MAALASAFLSVPGAVAAAALLPPVRKGVDQAFGTGTGARIEVGICGRWTRWLPATTLLCAARLRRREDFGSVPAAGCSAPDGTEVTAPYLVLRLDARTRRDTWRDIPEVRAAYHDLRTAVRHGDAPAAKSALGRFRRMAASSSRLLPQDADRPAREDGILREQGPPRDRNWGTWPNNPTGVGQRLPSLAWRRSTFTQKVDLPNRAAWALHSATPTCGA